jgi:hypothetical protein
MHQLQRQVLDIDSSTKHLLAALQIVGRKWMQAFASSGIVCLAQSNRHHRSKDQDRRDQPDAEKEIAMGFRLAKLFLARAPTKEQRDQESQHESPAQLEPDDRPQQ